MYAGDIRPVPIVITPMTHDVRLSSVSYIYMCMHISISILWAEEGWP